MTENKHPLLKYLRQEILPTPFCPGCGNGTILNAYVHAIDELGIDTNNIISVTGIGCSSWIPSPYLKADTLHTTHGRALAFATGVKVMKPDSKVIVIAGDGDIAGIGGNHLIHSARRNIGITVFLVNNYNYGMTGGQVSPTTHHNVKTTTTPYGNVEYPLKIAELVSTAGANYVARWTTYHVKPLIKSMKKALQKKGFSFVEIISQCHISYGKSVNLKSATDFLKLFKENSIKIEKTKNMEEKELLDRIIIGEFVERDREEFTDNLRKINEGLK